MGKEKKISEQSSFFESIFDKIDSAIFIIDVTSQGKFIYVNNNRSHQQGLGADKNFIKGKTPDDLVPLISQEYASTIKQNYQLCVEKKKPLQYDESFTVDKRNLRVSTRLIPLIDKSGRIYRIIGISTHITERKKAEKTLWNSEKRYRELVEKAGIAILMDDKDGNITYLNKKLAELYGYATSELKNKSIQSLVHPDDIDRVMKFHKARLQGKRVPSKYEFKGIRKDGSLIYLEVATVKLHDETHQEGTRSYLWDITNRKRAEEEKEKSIHSLKERTKELNCLYNISKSILEQNPLEVVLQDVVECIPPGWQYPEITRAKIVFDGKEFVSEPFEETQWKLSNAITVDGTNRGSVDVYYVEEFPELDEGPFLKEERVLINGISERIIGLIKRKEAEEALRFSEEQFSKSFHSSPLLMTISKIEDGTYLEVNKSFMGISEYSREDSIGTTSVDLGLISREDRENLKKTMLSQGKVNGIELTLKKKSGKTFYCLYFGELITIAGKQRLLSIAEDITERKQAREELKKSEEKYKTLIESSSDSIFIIKDGTIQYVNEELLRISGYSKKELIGQPFLNFVVPEERQKVKNYYFNRLAGKKVPDRYESKAIIKSGEHFPVEVSVILIQYKGEKATQVILRDISARKKAEEELHMREQEIRTITDNVPALVSYVDKEGYYRFVNKQYNEWFGIPKTEILGKHYREILGKAAQGRIKGHIKKTLSGKQVSYEEELPYKHGGTRWVTADYVPDVNNQGDVDGFFALVTDITDRKKAVEALEQHKQELQHLSFHLIHAQEEERQKISQELHDELGQMLTALSINLSFIDKLITKEYDPQIRERLEDSIQLVDSMSDHLNEMILDLHPSMLDDLGLIPTLRWYVKRFEDRTQIKVNLRVKHSKQQQTKDIETVLYRIIQEALTNTAKHAQAENAQISINQRKASLKVTIQDDGQGFDAEKVSSLPVHERGSGLTGMRERLLTVNGKLDISSKKGKGVRLEIIIPLGDKA